VNTHHDYAERFTPLFNKEVQSSYFGQDHDLSMEGSSIRFHTPESLQFLPNVPTETTMEMHSHFSNMSLQNAATTHFHMGVELEYTVRNAVMRKGSIWFDNCDGRAKQYRCGTALYLLSNLCLCMRL
jgi:hypothetical protein